MAPSTDSTATFLFCFYRIETSPAFERTVVCHSEMTEKFVIFLPAKRCMKLQLGESDGLVLKLRGMPHAHTPYHGAPKTRLRNAKTDL